MEKAERVWSSQDVSDLFDKPTVVEGSDPCVATNTLTLLTNGVFGFHIENVCFRRLISTRELKAVVYNPESRL